MAAASVSRVKSRISESSKAFDSAQNPDLSLGKGLPIARSRRTRLCSRRCGSIQAFRMWMRLQMPWQVGSNFLPVLRSYWSVSRSITPAPTFLLERFTFDHACCLTHSAKQNGLRNVPFLFRRGSGSPVVRSRIISAVIRLSWFTSGLCVSLRRSRRKTRERRNCRGSKNGVGGEAWGHFCASILALPCFPRGVRWGLRAPKPAPKSHWLSGLSSFDSRCECVLRGEGYAGITET